MENKLQQLTEKLYNEGLSKGRAEAEALVAKANATSTAIIAEARQKAETIVVEAKRAAEKLRTNTDNEIRMASGQLKSALRQDVERMVQMQVVTPQVSAAWQDGSFIKELIQTSVNALGDQAGKVILPENRGEAFVAEVRNALAERFGADPGVEVLTDGRVKVPFRIAPKDGGYYISFTDADFDALFASYLRPRVAEMLFGNTPANDSQQ